MAKQQQYDNQSITVLKGPDRVRKRPAVIFGSDGLEGCEHSFFEILSNAVDEAREGYGSEIITTVYRDRTLCVEDFGRGVPLDFNEVEGRWNWELVYCELYAGGKYENNEDGAAYEYSLGLNGLGACATQYSSEFMDVTSMSGGIASSIHFAKGEPISELEKVPLPRNRSRRTGTIVRWRPDLEVFTDTAIPREYFSDTLKKQAVVNAGVTFVLRWENEEGRFEEETYRYEEGISDYIRELAGDTAMTEPVLWKLETKGRDRADKDEYRLRAEIAFCVSSQVNVLEYYHNSSFLEHGGSPERAVRTAFTNAVDKQIRATGKYTKNEAKITFQDIQDCVIVVTNSFSTQTSYANQTKKAITNTFIAEAMTNFLKEQLEIYFIEHPAETEKFLNQVLVNKRSRESAESTRLNLKKKLTASGIGAERVEKFVSCRSKDPEKRELYIVEGDSALTSVKLGRDADFQAIIPVRGKTLNCLKASYDRIFKSEIICDLIRVIGCGVELQGKVKTDLPPFDLAQLHWSKIIFCTDADEDGFQIRTLLLTIFYRLMPTLIREGRIYVAESPLYEITAKDKTYFAYDEPEKEQITAKLDKAGKKYTLQRSKGLGENEPEMMWQTTMNPATRRLIRVNPADVEQTARIFETLLGDDLPARKDFIYRYGARYWDVADI